VNRTARKPPLRSLLIAVLLALLPAGGVAQPPRGAAWRVIDLATAQVVSEGQVDVLTRPSLPGSLMKLATLVAALESGTITAGTRIPCPGYAEVGGRRIACLHPRIRRPITAAEALAYSCNAFYAAVGARLSRARLDSVLASLGLPRPPPSAPMPLAAIGLRASPVAPAALLAAVRRVLLPDADPLVSAGTRAVVVEGMRGAAVFGTASAFAAKGLNALAKTGTADAPGGGTQGLVVAAWPAARPTRAAIVVVAGGGGPDAAAVAASLVQQRSPGSLAPAASPASSRAPAGVVRREARAESNVRVRVGHAQGRRYSVSTYSLEDYVASVLAGEAVPRSARAALEALAITVRTFALANRGRHARDGFDLCDLTHCQVLRPPTPATSAAAAATAGLVLAWDGAPAEVYYTASCGGHTERPSAVWPGATDPPYLPARADPGCGGEPQWENEIAVGDLQRTLAAAGYKGHLRELRVAGRTSSGRVAALALRGMTPDEVSGQVFRTLVGRALGWQLLKSTAFDLSRTSGGYRFSGHGFGHGVGFCVVGSARRAIEGATREQLLQAYFPGARVLPIGSLRTSTAKARSKNPPELASGEASEEVPVSDEPSVKAAPSGGAQASASTQPIATPAGSASANGGRVVDVPFALTLPDSDERERPALAAVIRRALQAAASRTGRALPAHVQIVFHPTSESFTRSTGQAWWTSARTDGPRIDVQPVSVLRQRNLLERTLAHEVGHLMTAPALPGRAEWVKEGAAMFAAGELDAAEISAARLERMQPSCPTDEEIRRPRSSETARAAYDRAERCFARALAAGQRWDEVR
jgi:SpoIID/LytB domain protein